MTNQQEEKGEKEDEEPLGARTRRFGIAILRECGLLPRGPEPSVVRNQLARSGTAPGSHWREAEHARSDAEFVAKVDLACQELAETRYWLEILGNLLPGRRRRLAGLYWEAHELLCIFSSISRDAKGNADDEQDPAA